MLLFHQTSYFAMKGDQYSHLNAVISIEETILL